MIGRPMATTDPKATSMITIAANTPMPVLLPGEALTTWEIGLPPSATANPCAENPRATSITLSTDDAGRWPAVASNWTTANPMRRSAETWPSAPGASGLRTLVTCGSGRTAATSRARREALTGSVSGVAACTTMSAVSPAWEGKRAASRFCACWEAEFPAAKLLLNALPRDDPSPIKAISAITQASSTRRRWS